MRLNLNSLRISSKKISGINDAKGGVVTGGVGLAAGLTFGR
jgi:hypothetical protein